MKYKTWFRLVLKAIGVLLLGLALPELLAQIGGYVLYRSQNLAAIQAAPLTSEIQQLLWMVMQPVIQIIIGLYLLLGGALVVNFCVPSNQRYCPECGYNLSQQTATASRCTECGTALPNMP